MSETSIIDDGPFNIAPPDEVAERDALVRAIEFSQGFALLLACCNRADHRDLLMADISAHLPGRRFQFIPLREPVRNLLIELRTLLESPTPDAIFVYGVEGWLPSGVGAEDNPFIRNLNAARNHFPREVPCPLIFWLPQHILATLARAAPDFCSVRSGLYSFCASPQVRDRVERALTSHDMTGMAGLAYDEKFERADALAVMLAEYEALPPELRDPLAEARLMRSLATLHQVLGNFQSAETLFLSALEMREARFGPNHPRITSSLNNLAGLYVDQCRYLEAEPLFRRALQIREASMGPDHADTASSLNNLAYLYNYQGRYEKAEPLFKRALEIYRAKLGQGHAETAVSLNNLAYLYIAQSRYGEAEPLLLSALEVMQAKLGRDHPNVATSLNSLAGLYVAQGRYAEAEPLYRRALNIIEASLGSDHPHTALVLGNHASLVHKLGREDEAARMTDRVQAIRNAHARRNAPASDEATSE